MPPRSTLERKATCEVCGKEWVVLKPPSAIIPRRCSRECYHKSREKKEDRSCPECGGVFTTWPCSPQVYCSHECGYKTSARKGRKPCEKCGVEMVFHPSHEPDYCSRSCASSVRVVETVHRLAILRQDPAWMSRFKENCRAAQIDKVNLDPDYAHRLREQSRLKARTYFHTPENERKRVSTIISRYPKALRVQWASAAGKSVRLHWNRGLTKNTDPRLAELSSRMMGHVPHPGSGRGKGGRRPDLDFYARSSWEVDVARVFNHIGVPFEYEPRTFKFLDASGKVQDTFLVDFHLPILDLWVEVSGWVSPEKQEKIRLFRLHQPDKNLLHLDKDVYAGLRARYRHDVPWEGSVSGIGDITPFMNAIMGLQCPGHPASLSPVGDEPDPQ